MPVPAREPRQIDSMQYQILDRSLAEATTAEVPYAVISVRSSELPPPRIPDSPNLLGVLRLTFDDIQIQIDGMILFDERHAAEVWAFYRAVQDKGARRLIIHCEQGMCRSAALGAALTDGLAGATWFERRFSPNAHVRRVMVEARTVSGGKTSGTTERNAPLTCPED